MLDRVLVIYFDLLDSIREPQNYTIKFVILKNVLNDIEPVQLAFLIIQFIDVALMPSPVLGLALLNIAPY